MGNLKIELTVEEGKFLPFFIFYRDNEKIANQNNKDTKEKIMWQVLTGKMLTQCPK